MIKFNDVLIFCRQEVIEMLLTEKDSQIALLEMAGAKTQSQIERLNRLHSDRCRINKRLKIEVFFDRKFNFWHVS